MANDEQNFSGITGTVADKRDRVSKTNGIEAVLTKLTDIQCELAAQRTTLQRALGPHYADANDHEETADDPLITRRWFAEFLGISLRTHYRFEAVGIVGPPRKIGNMSRWPKSEAIRAKRDIEAGKFAKTL